MIVLDTHAWLWLCLEPRRLSRGAAAAIRRAAKGGGLATLVDRSGVIVKEITPSVAALATHFPDDLPADPARSEGVALVSRDARIRASRVVDTVW